MRAIVFDGHNLSLTDAREVRDPGPTEVLVEIADEGQLRDRIELLHRFADEADRVADFDICRVPFELTMYTEKLPESPRLIDSLGRLETPGFNWVTIAIPCPNRAKFLESTERFGEEVVSHFC